MMSTPAPIRGANADPGPHRCRFRRPFLVRLLFGLALVAGSLVGPSAALAHAELATVTPADKSTVQGSPDQIVMTFVQNLDPTKSSIRIVDTSGTVVAQGGTVPAGKPREMDLVLPAPLAIGTYTIRWTTISTEDGETARGTTTFTVADRLKSPGSPAPASAAPSVAVPSAAPSVAPTVVPSAAPTTPATSTTDAVIPVVVVLVVLAGLGLWLLRGRRRAA